LRQTQVQVTTLLAELHQARGAWQAAIRFARQRLVLEPLHEPAQRQLMTLFALAGQPAAALRQYQEYGRLLQTELGLLPQPATVELAEAIRTKRIGSKPVASGSLPPVAPVLPTPMTPPADDEPAPVIEESPPAPDEAAFSHNLPAPGTPFVGREEELAQLQRSLLDPACRLLVLVGQSGSGKTRLALELAWRLVGDEASHPRFPDGVLYVALVGVQSRAGAVAAIAEAAGYHFYDVTDPQRQLLERLRDRRLLLLLDNFDLLLHEAEFVTTLLDAAPGLTLLLTAQATLNLQEEWYHAVTGMAYPLHDPLPGEELDHYDAVRFFVQSAQRARVGFTAVEEPEAVARICRLVGGLPLALELAAAWLKVLPAPTIAEELARGLDLLTARHRNAPERHRSMRVVLEQSWTLLGAAEQTALARLALFHDGFTQEAAMVVTGATASVLVELVERAILTLIPSGRYLLHDLLRGFVEEKLVQQDERQVAQLRSAHSAFYLDYLRRQGMMLAGRRQQHALDALAVEMDNVRMAYLWAAAQFDLAALRQAGDDLYLFYRTRSRFQEGQTLFTQAAAQLTQRATTQPELGSDPAYHLMQAWLVARQGAFAYHLGNYGLAQRQLAAGLRVAEEFDDRRETIFVLSLLGELEGWQGKAEEARLRLRRALALCRELGDRRLEAGRLLKLAELSGHIGDFGEGQELAETSLEICRALSLPDVQAYGLSLLAWFASCLGDYAAAAVYWQRSLDIRRELGDQAGIASCLNFLGWVAWCEGGPQLEAAETHLQQALALNHRLGYRLGMTMTYWKLSLVALEQGDYLLARRHCQAGLEIAEELESAIYRAANLLGLGMASAGLGDSTAAQIQVREGLTLTWRLGLLPSMILLLYGLAWVVVRGEGRTMPPEEAAQVVGWLRAVTDHPAAWRAVQKRAARLLAQLESQLPDQIWRAAQAANAAQSMAALPLVDRIAAVVREGATPV
jgi:predicted ATPase